LKNILRAPRLCPKTGKNTSGVQSLVFDRSKKCRLTRYHAKLRHYRHT